jgi:VWFA-related protein
MKSLTVVLRWLLVATAVIGSSHVLLAQDNHQASTATTKKPDGNLVIKSLVNRVILDVVVTDSSGKPVHGLTQKDFSVAEDGRDQNILSFDVHSLDAASDFAKQPPMPANTYVNIPAAPERGPLNVLLLDLVNTEAPDQAYARAQLLKFINEKPAGTRFAVFVLSDGLHLAQGFTDDQKQLYSVLDPANPHSHIPRIFLYQRNYGAGDIGLMVSVITDIGRFLDGLPGRKNLLWFAGNFPLTFSPTDDVKSYQDEIKGTLDILAEAQVAVYPIDARGVVYENAHAPAGATNGGGVTSDYRSGSTPSPGGGGTQPVGSASSDSTPFSNVPHAGGDQGYALLSASYMVQDEIAKTTGGRTFHSNNGLKELLEQAVEDGSNYYTLSYAPTNRNFNGARRAIHVELADRTHRYDLSYRRSYYGIDVNSLQSRENAGKASGGEPPAPRKLGDSLYANMQHGAPMAHQIVFRAHVHALGAPAMATPEQMANLAAQPGYFQARHKNKPTKALPPVRLQTYVIDYAVVAQPRPGAVTQSVRPPALEVAAAAYDEEGKLLNGLVEDTSPASASTVDLTKQRIFRAQQQFDVPLSATSIRVAVRDASTDRIGALEVTLPLALESPEEAAAPPQSGNAAPAKPN